VDGEGRRVVQPVRPDVPLPPVLVGERVVDRDAAVGLDAQDLAERAVERPGVLLLAGVADADQQRPVVGEPDAAAEGGQPGPVLPSGPSHAGSSSSTRSLESITSPRNA
jgi:hypothetical protein